MKKFFYSILIAIAVVGLIARLYRVTGAVADWHSWRQVDTAAVARNFLKFGTNPLYPRYDDLSNIQSGKDNPQGWRMVEFPLYQLLGVGLFRLVPKISIETALRIVSILSSFGSIILLGIIGRKYTSEIGGLCAALSFAILPYSIYYGRTILPESFMVFLCLAAIFFMDQSVEHRGMKRTLLIFLSAVVSALALLVKPYAIFLLLPVAILFLKTLRFTLWWFLYALFIGAITVLPLFLWREWILKFPEGIPVYTWLLNGGNIRFKGAWFYWLFAERIGKLILGYWGVLFLGVGFVVKGKKQEKFVYPFLALGALLYMSIIARGNVQHDYYQILILPVISLYVGKGISYLLEHKEGINRWAAFPMVGIALCFMLAFSWYEIRGYFWINHPEIVEAGQMADKLLPKNAKVIAPYNGDTTFLYQTNRQGWPIGFEIDKKIAMGAMYYVTVSPTDADGETKDLASRYTVLVRNDRYAIIDLTHKKVQ